MAEEKPDKDSQTEEPTEHKISKAEEKRNLPFSRELPTFASLVGYSIIAIFVALPSMSKLSSFLVQWIERPESWRLNGAEDVKHLMFLVGGSVGLALAPILVIIPVIGLASSMIQNAPRFVGERIRPQFSRISPLNGLNRIFGKAGFVEFLKSLAKLIGVSLIVYFSFFKGNTVFIDALATDSSAIPEYIRSEIAHLLISFAVSVVAIAGFDIAWSRFSWRRNLRMSKQELRDEQKEIEGNPMVKARMRSLARDRIRRQMMANVPKATMVIANPTHFSVALRYQPPADYAPVVIAKGQDILAIKIREIATEHDIPVIENVPLARALYKQVEVDQVIPQEFYQAVAELIRFVNSQKLQ